MSLVLAEPEWKYRKKSVGRSEKPHRLEYRIRPCEAHKHVLRRFPKWAGWHKCCKRYKTFDQMMMAMNAMNRRHELYEYRPETTP